MVSREEAFDEDAAAYAEDFDVDWDTARRNLELLDELRPVVGQIAEDYPESFAGWYVDHTPELTVTMRFVGDVPLGLDSSNEHLELTGNAPYSLQQLERRAATVLDGLAAVGFSEVVAGYDIRNGVIEATAVPPPPLADVEHDAVLAELPQHIREINADIEITNGPIAGDDVRVYGGVKATYQQTGGQFCTTGFSVRQIGTNNYGLSTAGHCENGIWYQSGAQTWYMDFRSGDIGHWGNFQWHTTSQNEYPEFYARFSARRPVDNIRPVSQFGQDDYVCKFGRNTGYTCDTIYRVSVQKTEDGETIKNLALMLNREADNGDSGGPWFLSYTAVGIHQGWMRFNLVARDTFSKADLMDDAIGVRPRYGTP